MAKKTILKGLVKKEEKQAILVYVLYRGGFLLRL